MFPKAINILPLFLVKTLNESLNEGIPSRIYYQGCESHSHKIDKSDELFDLEVTQTLPNT